MITDAILDWFFGLVDWALVASREFVGDMPVTLSLGWISDMNYFLPISEMFQVFAALFLLGGPFIGTSLVVWLLVGVLRGGATKT